MYDKIMVNYNFDVTNIYGESGKLFHFFINLYFYLCINI